LIFLQEGFTGRVLSGTTVFYRKQIWNSGIVKEEGKHRKGIWSFSLFKFIIQLSGERHENYEEKTVFAQ